MVSISWLTWSMFSHGKSFTLTMARCLPWSLSLLRARKDARRWLRYFWVLWPRWTSSPVPTSITLYMDVTRGPRGPAVAFSSADNNPWPARICAMKWPHVRHFAAAGAGRVTRDVTFRKVSIWPGFRPKSRVGAGFGPQNFGTALGHAKCLVSYVKMWTKCSSCLMTKSGFVSILVYPYTQRIYGICAGYTDICSVYSICVNTRWGTDIPE